MSYNRPFWKAFHSLTHPLSLLAIMLLLFNDHWLRYAHPSWLTGKLGDFTWLVFAPFIAGLVFAWIIPRRLEYHTDIVGGLSIGFIGVWFATSKTIPFVHHLTTETLYTIVGWEGQLRLDVTDLLTLPALIISVYIWQKASDDKVSLKPFAYVALGLGLLGTLASDSPQYAEYGIREICYNGEFLSVTTQSMWGNITTYESYDGGLNWRDRWEENNKECVGSSIDENAPSKFRWSNADKIEISEDNGESWQVDYDLGVLRQEARYVKRRLHIYSPSLIFDDPGPHSVVYDEASDNYIFAMGWDGVLVRQSDGKYVWSTVGHYNLPENPSLTDFHNLIFLEFCLAIATAFLVIVTSTWYIRHHISMGRKKVISFSWIVYVLIMILVILERHDPISASGGSLTVSVPVFAGLVSFCAMFIFAIPLSLGAMWDILRNFRSVALNIALAAIGSGMLFIFPFLLWTQGRIPRYVTAYAFSIMLTVFGLYASWLYLKRILPSLEPEKLKNDAVEKDKKEV